MHNKRDKKDITVDPYSTILSDDADPAITFTAPYVCTLGQISYILVLTLLYNLLKFRIFL